MKSRLLFCLIPLAGLSAASSFAAEEATSPDWIIHARGISVSPNAKSVLPLGVKSKIAPELDFTRMFGPNFGVELILATSQHDIQLSGAAFGKVSVLPPTLTLTYRFDSMSGFRPYIGYGVNYTLFYNVELPAGYDVERRSFGMAAQAGFDYELEDRWVVNLDIKKIDIQTDVKNNGARADILQINPWVFGLGVGYRL